MSAPYLIRGARKFPVARDWTSRVTKVWHFKTICFCNGSYGWWAGFEFENYHIIVGNFGIHLLDKFLLQNNEIYEPKNQKTKFFKLVDVPLLPKTESQYLFLSIDKHGRNLSFFFDRIDTSLIFPGRIIFACSRPCLNGRRFYAHMAFYCVLLINIIFIQSNFMTQ